MRVAIVGNNDGPLVLLKALENSDCKLVFLGLQKPVSDELTAEYKKVSGREPVVRFRESGLLKHLKTARPDLVINCFCNFIFTTTLERYFVINVHPSPLPEYRGRHPLQWALINGVKTFGASLHKMVEKVDAGEIYKQVSIQVHRDMSVFQLRSELLYRISLKLPELLEEFEEKRLKPKPNPDHKATYVVKRQPADSRLTEWSDSQLIYRKIKALRSESYPAYFTTGGADYIVTDVRDHPKMFVAPPQPVITSIMGDTVTVACKDGHTLKLTLEHTTDLTENTRIPCP